MRHSYDLVASESKYAFCLLKISWNGFIQVSLWHIRFVTRFAAHTWTWSAHSENHSKACLAIHHSLVGLLGFYQRERFDHWTDIREHAEIKGVLGLDGSSCEAANN